MNIPFVDLKLQYKEIQTEIENAIFKVIQSARFIQSEEVNKFEEEFANYLEANYCIGVNLGTDEGEITMLKLAQKVAKLLGNNVKIEKIPYPPGYPKDEPQRRRPDLTKIRNHLGYVPEVDLDIGLRRFIGWCREAYNV